MNYKLEKFWNLKQALKIVRVPLTLWTINLKSFEILVYFDYDKNDKEWTINLKSFEIYMEKSVIDAIGDEL